MPHPPLFYALLIGCSLLAVGLAWSAWQRPDRRRRALRLVAGVLAAAALWFTVYPPLRYTTRPAAEAILLTEGYQPDTLRTLLRRLGPATRIWRYAPGFVASQQPNLTDTATVASLLTLRQQLPGLQRLHLLGRGLPESALPALGPVRLVRHAPPVAAGFVAARWNRRLEQGQPLIVEGRWQGAGSGTAVWVRLQAEGAPRDSVQVPGGAGTFRLRYTPKSTGRLVATLSAGPRRELLASEPLPLEVQPTRALRVLLVGSTPSFELKFLKNHLAARSHSVAWRTGISRGISQTEFSNHPATDLSRLSSSLLARYDIVVAEASALAGLPATEVQALRAAQRRTGLGLVVLAEAAGLPAAVPGRTALRIVPTRGPDNARARPVSWPNGPAARTVVPGTLVLAPPARPLVTLAGSGAAVAGALRQGAGTTVVATLPESYAWQLQNSTAAYEGYWSCLLTAAARPAAPAAQWTALDPWPRPNLPVALHLSSTAALPTPLALRNAAGQSQARLPLQQDIRLPEWSTATYWPTQAGWQQAQLPGQPAQWFYVFQEADWQGPELVRRASAEASWLASGSGQQRTLQVAEPWPAGWFFLLFLLAAGFLWLEEKL